MKRIQFWFEYSSPYSALSVFRIKKMKLENHFDYIPFLLGPVFKSLYGESTSHSLPIKRQYMFRDFARRGAELNLKTIKPEIFPINALTAARITCYLINTTQYKDKVFDFIYNVYHSYFVENKDISNTEVLKTILSRSIEDYTPILQAASNPDIKKILHENTESACKSLFGSPFFITSDGELFWGDDRLEQVLKWQERPGRL